MWVLPTMSSARSAAGLEGTICRYRFGQGLAKVTPAERLFAGLRCLRI
jgi:hypothetical protein